MVLSVIGSLALLGLPLGLGGLTLSRSNRQHLSSQIAFAWLVGATAWVCIHVLAQQAGYEFRYVTLGLIGLSILGLAKAALVVERSQLRDTALAFCAALPAVILTRYALPYWVLSDYPLTNIFQEVQTFDSVTEFIATGQLYAQGADSYTPLRQVIYTTFYDLLGLRPLDVFYFAPFSLLAVTSFAAIGLAKTLFPRGPLQIATAVAIAVVAAPPYPTNNALLTIAAILLLSTCVDRSAWLPSLRSFLLLAAASVCSIALIALMLRGGETEGSFLVGFAAAVALSLLRTSARFSAAIAVILLVACAAALHRSAVVFVPTAIMSAALFGLAGWAVMHGRHGRLWLAGAMGALAVAATIFPVLTVLEEAGLISISGHLQGVYSVIAEVIIRQPITPGSDIALGTGSRNALIELIRLLGPIAAITCGVVGLFGIAMLIQPGRGAEDNPTIMTASGSWLASMGLFFLMGSGLPFVYRAGVLALVLLTVSVCAFLQLMRKLSARSAAPLIGLAIIVALSFLIAALYSPAGLVRSDATRQYLALALPYLAALAGLSALLFAAAVFRPAVAIALSIVGASFAFEADRAGMTALFWQFSYGMPPEKLDVITFYNRDEITAAERLRDGHPNWIVVSDPITVSVARAFGGAIAPINYSNLDTLGVLDAPYRNALSALLNPEVNACPSLSHLLGAHGSSALNSRLAYETTRGTFGNKVRNGTAVEYLLKTDPDWSMVLVVTPRTLEWMANTTTNTLFFPLPAGDDYRSLKVNGDYLIPIDLGLEAVKAYRVDCTAPLGQATRGSAAAWR